MIRSPAIDRRQFARICAAALAAAPWTAFASSATRDLARAAYVWGYPTVDLYAILNGQALDPRSPEFKAPLNRVGHARQVASPEDRAVIAPNVDTPYSYAWMDLRAEPVVITVPPFEADRYVSLQLFDLYTWILGYVTPRTNGNAGGDFMVVPPGWQGEAPPGIEGVFRSTTALALGLFRTQLFEPADIARVHALQDGYRVRTLSAWLGKPGPAPLPMPQPVTPLNLREQPASPAFFEVLAWMMRFMPALPEDAALRRSFEDFGLAPGKPFEAARGELRDAIEQGMRDGLAQMGERARRVRSSAELFGSREFLKDDYLSRATGAMLGILGNSAEEYLGVGYQADSEGRAFDGRHRYRIRFGPHDLPPVGAFWSITAYTGQRLLYANPLRRHVINSPMLPRLARDADGGLTLYLQNDSPGEGREANWLPVPAAPFALAFRTYLPGEAIRRGAWTAPPVMRAD